MILAIFQDERIYEGRGNLLNAVYPMPTISTVAFDPTTQAGLKIFGEPHPSMPVLFREDSFDPTSRLRRGRFYRRGNRRTYDPRWVNHHPYAPPVAGFPLTYEMDIYDSLQPSGPVRGYPEPLILLGDAGHKTAWRVIDSERLFNGETQFTLKSANSLGVLPNLVPDVLPVEKRIQIEQGYEKTIDAANKYLPESIVDVCREFARVMLAAWLPSLGVEPKGDLSDLVKAVPAERTVVKSAATIINRLHSRGKSSEHERQAGMGNELRSVSREDGELSIDLVACLLREFRWGS